MVETAPNPLDSQEEKNNICHSLEFVLSALEDALECDGSLHCKIRHSNVTKHSPGR
jgi:hypothetical protein